MVTKVLMPRLSLTMKEGTIGKWYKKEGDKVERGEPVVEVISEKATYDLEAPSSGILQRILVQQGVDTPVNSVLALITAPGESVSEEEASPQATKISEFQSEERILASPAARRLAREHGVDLAIVKGSGPEGRIDEDDVKRVIGDRGRVSPRVKQLIPLSGLKKTSAERVSMSFRTAPHSTIVMEVDVSEAAELHKKTGVSYTAIILKAAANTLKEVPLINSTLEDNKIKVFEDANIGVAVATENGLIVPVVHESDQKRVKEIDFIIKELTEKARGGKLSKEDLTGGTFTISNLGMYGVDFFTPIINPPEGAILGVGRVNEKPVAIGTNIKIKPVIMLSLSYDHRIIDGAPAAEFLQKTKEKIERPGDL